MDEVLEIGNGETTRVVCIGCLKTFASDPNLERHQRSCDIYIKSKRIAELEAENANLREYILQMLDVGRKIEGERNSLRIQLITLRQEGQFVINALLEDQRY